MDASQIVHSRPWEEIRMFYSGGKPAMADFVEWLSGSRYAHGIFATTSLFTLVIGQSPEFDFFRNVIRISESAGQFTVRFSESMMSYTERDYDRSEIRSAFEELVASLRWFSASE